MQIKISPSASVTILFSYISLSMLFRFLLGNIYGIFILSVGIYLTSSTLFEITPFSVTELLTWFINQSEDTKNTILGSLITVTGFMVAYASATANWKEESLAQLKMHAANDIANHLSNCVNLASDCERYASTVLRELETLKENGPNKLTTHIFEGLARDTVAFKHNREKFLTLQLETYHIQSQFSNILIAQPLAHKAMNRSIKALEELAEIIWIKLPLQFLDEDEPVNTFVKQIDVEEYKRFRKVIDKNTDEISYYSGAIRGALQSTIIGFNIWSLAHLLQRETKDTLLQQLKNNANINEGL